MIEKQSRASIDTAAQHSYLNESVAISNKLPNRKLRSTRDEAPSYQQGPKLAELRWPFCTVWGVKCHTEGKLPPLNNPGRDRAFMLQPLRLKMEILLLCGTEFFVRLFTTQKKTCCDFAHCKNYMMQL